MAATQQDIDDLVAQVAALNTAIADGVRSVTLGESTVTYNTTDSLIRARDDVQARLAAAQAELAAQAAPVQRGRMILLSQRSRGYD